MINIGICDDEASMRKALRTPLELKLQLLGADYQIYEYDSGEALTTRPEAELSLIHISEPTRPY